MEKKIIFFGNSVTLRCDGKCNKAWGLNGRPQKDGNYLKDSELGDAPEDPGTYEGEHGKPCGGFCTNPELMNKWCARECERSAIDGELPVLN